MRSYRPGSTVLASTVLVALIIVLLASSPASAERWAEDDDDGVSIGDTVGVLTDPDVIGATAGAIPELIGGELGDGLGDLAEGAAGGIAASMAEGAIALLEEFASWWTSWTVIDLRDSGVDSPLAMALGMAMLLAWLLLVLEAGRAAYSGDGTALGNAVVGLVKVTVVVAVLVPFVQALLYAADELTMWIVESSFGDMDGLEAKLTSLFEFDPVLGLGLLFVFGLIGIVLVLLLMFEFVLRHAGILIMLCAAPIAAAGMIARPTADWWPKAAKGLLTLVMLKPVVAFIFAIAFGIVGDTDGVQGLVVGMAALIAASVAWPVVASYFTFTSIGGGGSVGAALAGGAGGWLGTQASGTGRPSGSAARSGSAHSLAVERDADADQAGSVGSGPTAVAPRSASAKPRGRGAGGRPVAVGAPSGTSASGTAGAPGPKAGGSGAGGSKAGGSRAGSAGAVVAATAVKASVTAAREGVNQTSAGMTDMARHAGLSTPHPAAGAPVPDHGRPTSSGHGRHRRSQQQHVPSLDGAGAAGRQPVDETNLRAPGSAGADRPRPRPADPATSEQEEL